MTDQEKIDLITNFYTAFQNRDSATMANSYHDDASFEDPAFGKLNSADAKLMWEMLIARADERLAIRFSDIRVVEGNVQANWEADYNFSRTNRFVQNKISAEFKFKDGKIIEHIDRFNLWKWSAMALGLSGTILGWSGLIQRKINKTALKGLDGYKKKKA